jgi:hypothetical protein
MIKAGMGWPGFAKIARPKGGEPTMLTNDDMRVLALPPRAPVRRDRRKKRRGLTQILMP